MKGKRRKEIKNEGIKKSKEGSNKEKQIIYLI